MPRWRRIVLVVATLIGLVGCDQKTKTLARQHLREAETKSFLADTLRLDYTENPGAFLSLGAALPARWRRLLLTIGCSAGIAAILLYTLLASQPGPWQVLAMSLISAGGIGNLADRWMNGGYVRDFLDVGFGPIRTGIFNVADAALVAGCLILLLVRYRSRVSAASASLE
jgi:signal peptidase II